MPNTHDLQTQPSGTSRDATRGPLFVDVCGIAMFLPEHNKVVVVDARKPRVAVTDGSMIAPHMPIIGIQAGTYAPLPPSGAVKTIGKVSFDYDIDGSGQPVRFDAFVLDRHVVRFTNVIDNRPTQGGKRFGSMKLLSPNLELCTGVSNGTSRQVIGTVDFSNALAVDGKGHGMSDGPLTFGHNIVDCADMAMATFEVGNAQPAIELDKGTEKLTITLTGDGPWRVMVGNFPIEEIVGLHPTDLQHNVPLTHLELYYDLYHVGRHEPIPVPRGDNHVHARTANGRCGPTLIP